MHKKLLLIAVFIVSGLVDIANAQTGCPPVGLNTLLEGNSRVCSGNNSGKVYIKDDESKFDVLEWFYSYDTINWSTVFSTTGDTLNYTDLTQTTYYKAKVEYHPDLVTTCTPDYTNYVKIQVDSVSDAGVLTNITKGCRYTHNGTLVLENYTGKVQKWLMYDTVINIWAEIMNTTNKQSFYNLSMETFYRPIVKNGVCPPDTLNATSVRVYMLPETDFTYPDSLGRCFGTEMSFRNETKKVYEPDNRINSYLWEFGDGAVQTETTTTPVTKTYFNPGTFNVKLTTTTENGCQNSVIKPVQVFHLPEADFSFTNACFGDSVYLRNRSILNATSGTIAEYNWGFGDMGYSTEENPVHKYTLPQSYDVALTVKSIYGCKGEKTQTVHVYNNPIADFYYDSVCFGTKTNFTNYSSSEDGMLSAFWWDFDDGERSPLQHPMHVFSEVKTYDVKLFVQSDKGCKDSIIKQALVHPIPTADFTIVNACDGYPIVFTNQSSVGTGNINGHYWEFGDGAFSREQNPSRLYFNPATYGVTLTVTSDNGCEDKMMKEAIVFRNPIADFYVENECFNTPITMQAKSSIRNSENLIYEYNLGDGEVVRNKEFQYTYGAPGYYPITLTVISDQGGCVDSITQAVRIYELPQIDAGENIYASKGYTVQLQATGGEFYNWTPALGLSHTAIATPYATPLQTTTYKVEGTDEYGCINYDSVTVFVSDDQKVIPTNLITPDGNGQNDTWVITNIENYSDAVVKVFDLHGKEIFSTRNYQNTWDGRNKNGDILPDGTYYYMIIFDDSKRVYKGSITVIRNK